MTKNIDKTSKFLSYVLRHKPESIGIKLDREGWVEIDALIKQAHLHNEILDMELIDLIVTTSAKKRFTISGDHLKIRAAQGHSTEHVNIAYKEVNPPEFLYHGTATRFLGSIKEKGLLPVSRQYVHLSSDEETARIVGQRHGKPIILKVTSREMRKKGFAFYLSENGVWLTKEVPVDFLIFD